MKKELFVVFSILIISSSFFVFAANEDNQGVPSLLSQIKEVLLSILEKLDIIADKDFTAEVIVEPNITVEIPEIIVNPNITIPERECKWEKLNQEIPINTGLVDQGYAGYYEVGFMLPNDVSYSDFNLTKFGITLRISVSTRIFVNEYIDNTPCYTVGSGSSGYYIFHDLTNNCLSELKEGTNTILIYPYGSGSGIYDLKGIYVEMEVLPANC